MDPYLFEKGFDAFVSLVDGIFVSLFYPEIFGRKVRNNASRTLDLQKVLKADHIGVPSLHCILVIGPIKLRIHFILPMPLHHAFFSPYGLAYRNDGYFLHPRHV